jgi:putative DNA primase/helicase
MGEFDWMGSPPTPKPEAPTKTKRPNGNATDDLGDYADMAANEEPASKTTSIKVEPGKRHLIADAGMQALMDKGIPFYQRDFKIARVALVKAKNCDGETFEIPGILPVTPAIMERALGQSANWVRDDGRSRKAVTTDPPRPVVQQILDMSGEWLFPPLTGIIQCPTMRRDGTILDTPGYDDATGLLLVNSLPMRPIEAVPTMADAMAALALIKGLLIEFPFVDEASRAVALSMMLTSVLRGAMEVSPMHLVTAPRPGSGKSYMADVAAMVSTGDRCAVKSASPSAEETEKRLIGSALEGHPIIALDNCREILQGDFLCQVTERPLLSLRALGKSPPHLIHNTFTFFANGNNIAVADDMVRRTIRCAMDANCENPELRTFKLDPLVKIRANRGKYVAACLTIARAYIVAGRPDALPPLASYAEWSSIVRDPLVWLGCNDAVSTMETLRQEDPKGAERHNVFAAWKSAIGVSKGRAAVTQELLDKAAQHTELHEALLAVSPQRFGEAKIDPRALGKWLSAQEKSIAAGCKLMTDRTNKARPKWYLEPQQK